MELSRPSRSWAKRTAEEEEPSLTRPPFLRCILYLCFQYTPAPRAQYCSSVTVLGYVKTLTSQRLFLLVNPQELKLKHYGTISTGKCIAAIVSLFYRPIETRLYKSTFTQNIADTSRCGVSTPSRLVRQDTWRAFVQPCANPTRESNCTAMVHEVE